RPADSVDVATGRTAHPTCADGALPSQARIECTSRADACPPPAGRRRTVMTQPRVAQTPSELIGYLAGIAHVDGDRLVIDDETAFRAEGIRDVVWSATFTDAAAPPGAARW